MHEKWRALVAVAGALFAPAVGAGELYHAKPIPATYFGMHVHRAHDPAFWPQVRFGTWRMWDAGVTWAMLEPAPGVWKFQRLDELTARAQVAGAEVLLPLAMTPLWASARPERRSFYGPGQASEPREMADWERYVRAVATRYRGRIRHYEIWNEPGSSRFFNGGPQKLVDLQQRAYRILKEVDPDNVVVSPALTKFKDLDWFDRYLALGGGDAADVVAYHFYTADSRPERIVDLVRAVRERMQANGVGDKPLWNTEAGFGTAEDKDPQLMRDGYMLRWLILAWAAGVERFYYYSWDHLRMGLLAADRRQVNSAGRAFDFAARHLTGAREVRCPDSGTLRVCALRLADGTRARLVWATDAETRAWTAPRAFAGGRARAPRGDWPIGRDRKVSVDATPRLLTPPLGGPLL